MSCSCFGSSLSKKKTDLTPPVGEIEGQLLEHIRHFSYKELRTATNNFHLSNKIGRGGFGTVYKGVLKNGIQVAVKTLSAESKQGVREFLTEIDTISNVKHPNLVELIGCCVEGTNRILLYEYIENNSLDHALLGFSSDRSKLNWARRSSICLGTARGLVFLHEELVPHIVHRDIKASNILLDREFLPKIGDFGLAKLFPDDITHISTRIAGTTGYLAPEYALGGQLTMKADVYSFGVLVLEIVSGRSSSKMNCGGTQKLLLEWVCSKCSGSVMLPPPPFSLHNGTYFNVFLHACEHHHCLAFLSTLLVHGSFGAKGLLSSNLNEFFEGVIISLLLLMS